MRRTASNLFCETSAGRITDRVQVDRHTHERGELRRRTGCNAEESLQFTLGSAPKAFRDVRCDRYGRSLELAA